MDGEPSALPAAGSAGTSLRGRIGARSSFSVNMISNYLGRGWEAAMSIAFVPLYIRFLGVEAYGVIGLLAVIQSFMMILDFGMTPTLTREASRYQSGEQPLEYFRDLVRSIEWLVAAAALVIVAALALAAPWIADHWVRAESLAQSDIAVALSVGGALIAMRFFESVFRGTLYGLERQALANGIAALFATVRGAGSVAVVALTDFGLTGFFAWQAAVSLVTVVAMRAAVRWSLPLLTRRPRFSATALRAIGRFALGMVAISLLALAATQADKLILSRLLSLEAFGYYMFAANVALMLELASAPLMTALYPRVIDFMARRDEAGLTDFFHRWARVVAVLTAPAAAWLVFFAEPIILLWSGDPVLAARSGPLLSVLAIGMFLHAQCVLPYQVQLAAGWTGLGIWSNAAALVTIVPALLLLAPRFGAFAGAWTWLAVASLYFLMTAGVMFARLLRGERARFVMVDVIVPATAAFAVAALCHALVPIGPGPWAADVALLALAFLVSLAAAAVSAWLIERRDQKVRGGSGLSATASQTSA